MRPAEHKTHLLGQMVHQVTGHFSGNPIRINQTFPGACAAGNFPYDAFWTPSLLPVPSHVTLAGCPRHSLTPPRYMWLSLPTSRGAVTDAPREEAWELMGATLSRPQARETCPSDYYGSPRSRPGASWVLGSARVAMDRSGWPAQRGSRSPRVHH